MANAQRLDKRGGSNIYSKKVYLVNIPGIIQKTNIDCSNFELGNYFVKVYSDKFVYCKKLVITK